MNDRRTYIFMYAALTVLGVSLVSLLYGIYSVLPREAVYDCSIAEISPDYTPAMKQQCRNKQKEAR
jgi:predicted cation transporter